MGRMGRMMRRQQMAAMMGGGGPPMGPMGMGPPPMGPGFGPPFGRPPWMRGMGMRRRMEMMGMDIPPPVPPPPPIDDIPPPMPPPQPMPMIFYTPQMQKANLSEGCAETLYSKYQFRGCVTSINTHTTAFQGQGNGYDQVVNILKQFYGQRSRMTYDVRSVQFNSFGDRTELSANSKIAPVLYEMDMVLTVKQARQLLGGRQRFKRKMSTNDRWSTLVPYKFAVTNDVPWQNTIRKAINLYEQNTCIRFQENGAGNDYIYFNQGEGCYSSVGRLGGAQEISIGYGCETIGVICHEIGHSLGFWHEQARSDRDTYVNVNLGNVMKGGEGQFEKKSFSEVNNYGISYDYGSLMHYSRNAFAKEARLNTIEPRDPSYLQTIGTRLEPSFLDYKLLNLAMCSGICSNSLPCQHSGYPDPNNCGICKCPEGLGGVYCDQLKPSSKGFRFPIFYLWCKFPDCGREIVATGEWQELRYSGAQDCYWRIRHVRSK
ncbi:hypothetical protein WR25_01964 isoform A [Diploscapter pachys]|uniref:Metalloendopeptidase n=1 Tax=Diploscapter pachys TaxID=2018661 RepID=A0A2A2L105_9BILA|nr:hypothetical protein WR25_01964 isoform A [Diploscapter pachys]